jgi:uncharacterized protein
MAVFIPVAHFHEKLLKLKDRMYTETATEIAEERHAFLRIFLDRLEKEEGGSISGDSSAAFLVFS